MRMGNTINITGVTGASDLSCEVPAPTTQRRVRVYLVPADLVDDRYFISVTDAGCSEIIPPCRSLDTVLLVDFSQDADGRAVLNFQHPEVM